MELENQLKNNIEESGVEEEKTDQGEPAVFQSASPELQRGGPVSDNVSIRTMESDIKSLEGKEEIIKPEEVLPREEKQPELTPETTVQIAGLIEAEKPKKKMWLLISGGTTAAVVLGLLVYFVLLPLIFKPKEAEQPADVFAPLPVPEIVAPVIEKHQSYFVMPAFSIAQVSLPAVNIGSISLALQKESARKLADAQVKEIEILDYQNSQVVYSEFISQFLGGLDKASADQVFEKDFTAYLYYDQNGVWPGYIAKIKDVSQVSDIMFSFGSLLEQGGRLAGFYLESVKSFSPFKDGKISANATRYSVGSKPGESFNYGVFGNYFVISTSFDGLKAAFQLLGI